jgi:hypothetical protein
VAKIALGALVPLAVAIGGTPPAADAATGYARCPAGYFCIFSGYNGTGTIAYFRYGSPDLRQQHIDNASSSVWNRSGKPAREFTGYHYSGSWACSFAGSKGNFWPHWQRVFSSVRVGSCG